MGYLAEMSDGNYILCVSVGRVTLIKVFKPVEKSLDEISTNPMPDGFYLQIPEIDSFGSNDKED